MFRWSRKKKHSTIYENDAPTDEVTQRFTINLPNGHKSMARVSPLSTIGDIVSAICKENGIDLDLNKYALEIPKNPGKPVDLNASIQQMGVQEINLVSLVNQDRNHTMSMPDLSKLPPSGKELPSFATPNGQPKKKRGFLSFLSKKDKKYKSESFRSLNINFPPDLKNSTTPSSTPTTPVSSLRTGSDEIRRMARPKSMFVHSNTIEIIEGKLPEQSQKPLVAPPRKKHRAPEPPVVVRSSVSENKQNESLQFNIDSKEISSAVQTFNETNQQNEVAARVISSEHASENKSSNILHSCNSSESSGYHDLTHSRCESPETAYNNDIKIQTSIDVTSPETSDSVVMDSRNIFPTKVSLSNELQKRSEGKIVSATEVHISDTLKHGSSDISNQNRKTQVSYSPRPTSSSSTIASTTTSSSPVTKTIANSSPAVTQKVTEETGFSITNHSDLVNKTYMNEKPDPQFSGVDDSKNASLSFDDILDGIVFEDEPWSMELTLSKIAGIGGWSKDQMMMRESASVSSENLDQVDISPRKDRPCAFIPPPPPSEPPPPEQKSGDLESWTSINVPIFVDKGTEVSDDNSSLASSSAKSSPGRVISGSTHEMALFVEQVDSMHLEGQQVKENKLLNDSVSNQYILDSHKNINTRSINGQAHPDFTDSGSVSLARNKDKNLKDIGRLSHVTNHAGNFQDQIKERIVLSERMTEPSLTEVVPLENDNKDQILQNETTNDNNDDDEDEEEYYTEIIEELIIPLGPNGYDFSAARKKTEMDMKTVHVAETVQNAENKNVYNVFNTKSDSTVKVSSTQITSHSKLAQSSTSLPQYKKEEFVLTAEDLSHVSFLPPKSEIVKPYADDQFKNHLSSRSIAASKPGNPVTNTKTSYNSKHENVPHKIFQNNNKSNSDAHNQSTTAKELTALPKLPTMRTHIHTNNSSEFSVDDYLYNNDRILAKSRPHLLMNVQGHSSRRSDINQMGGADYLRNDHSQRSLNNGSGSDAVVDNKEHPGSITSASKESSAEFPARNHQQVAGAAEPTYMTVDNTPSTSSSPWQQSKVLKGGNITQKKRPKIERELGPREQLMIAIRTFSKRELNSVPIEKTRWTNSALS